MDESQTIEFKTGWRTTEFYVTLITAMLPIITAVFHKEFDSAQVQAWSTMAAAIATVGYSLSRSHNKNGVALAKAKMAAAPPTATAVSVQADSGAATATVAGEGATALPLDMVVSILARLEYLTDAVKAKDIQLKD